MLEVVSTTVVMVLCVGVSVVAAAMSVRIVRFIDEAEQDSRARATSMGLALAVMMTVGAVMLFGDMGLLALFCYPLMHGFARTLFRHILATPEMQNDHPFKFPEEVSMVPVFTALFAGILIVSMKERCGETGTAIALVFCCTGLMGLLFHGAMNVLMCAICYLLTYTHRAGRACEKNIPLMAEWMKEQIRRPAERIASRLVRK